MYHFIGIKGSGMASLATILNDLGYSVQGSDIEKHFFTEIGLIERNISIFTYNIRIYYYNNISKYHYTHSSSPTSFPLFI